MPDFSRRAMLRLGAGVAAGAFGGYALDMLIQPRPSQAVPISAPGTQAPLAPPAPLEPAPPGADHGDGLIRVCGARWHID